jgi:hypothetical protein
MTDVKMATLNIAEDMAFVKSSHEKEIMQKQRNDIRRWLRVDGIESDARYQEALSQRHTSTGSWILTSTPFLQWSDDASSCLWLYGIGKDVFSRLELCEKLIKYITAGCGKTVLAFAFLSPRCSELTRYRATIINHFYRDISSSASSQILYFFCDHRDPTKRSLNDLLCVVIKQLLDSDVDCFTEIKPGGKRRYQMPRQQFQSPSRLQKASTSSREYAVSGL